MPFQNPSGRGLLAIALLCCCAWALASAHEDELRVMQWEDSLYHQQRLTSLLTNIAHLNQTLRTRSPRLFAPNALDCDVCMSIANDTWHVLQSGGVDFHLIEWVATVACAEAISSKEGQLLCEDLVDGLMGLAHTVLNDTAQFHFNYSVLACADLLQACSVDCCANDVVPEQVHLSFTAGDALLSGSMTVAWVTRQSHTPLVMWWPTAGGRGSSQTAPGASRTYTVGGWLGWSNSAVMTGLESNTTYTYTVGSLGGGWSPEYEFHTLPLSAGTAERPLRVVTVADMGVGGDHAATLAQWKELVDAGSIDFVLHSGDISYADGDMYRWDRFMRELEPIAARVPYMTCPGNHEALWNFTAYKTRFYMPPAGHGAPNDAMYYSFSVGPFRFVHLDSETWYDTPKMDPAQVAWAERVFADANQQGQFIWVGLHRPLYCSTEGGQSCSAYSEFLRARLEGALYQQQVGIVHTGHLHNYERTLPVFNGTVTSTNYDNISAPVYYVNGAGGCIEGLTNFGQEPRPNWSADRIERTGYLSLTLGATNTSEGWTNYAVESSFVLSRNRTIADSVTITQFK